MLHVTTRDLTLAQRIVHYKFLPRPYDRNVLATGVLSPSQLLAGRGPAICRSSPACEKVVERDNRPIYTKTHHQPDGQSLASADEMQQEKGETKGETSISYERT